jgi:hypothetical protein
MEKYSVDKENDKVEKRAQDLVKTGDVKSISKARRIAAEEDNTWSAQATSISKKYSEKKFKS